MSCRKNYFLSRTQIWNKKVQFYYVDSEQRTNLALSQVNFDMIDCVRSSCWVDASKSHYRACGRPGSCSVGTELVRDYVTTAVRCVADVWKNTANGWYHTLEDQRCADRFDGMWWASDASGFGGCQTMNFHDAEAFCISQGARLPTLVEVEDGCVANSGCGYDSVPIWTSTGRFVLGKRNFFKKEALTFRWGNGGVDACPEIGYRSIGNARVCQDAALALGRTFTPPDSAPSNSICYQCSGCTNSKQINFNTNHGDSAQYLCRQERKYMAYPGCSSGSGDCIYII